MPTSTARPLNAKCKEAFKLCYSYILLTGAVRAGKTVISIIVFFTRVLLNGSGQYLITASSLGSIGTNILTDKKFGALALYPMFKRTTVDGRHALVYKDIIVWLIGASNSSDFERIRGATLRGWMADEINLCPKSFIDEALKRLMAESKPIVVWTWNPDVDTHFIYKDYVDVWMNEFKNETLYIEFNLLDNPIMTLDDVIKAKKTMSTQAFNRYVLGKRGNTEGMIYVDFKPNEHIITDVSKYKFIRFAIGVDFGESKSDNVFTLVGFTEGWNEVIILDELNMKGSTTYDVVNAEYTKFVQKAKQKYDVTIAYMDKASPMRIQSMPRGIGIVNNSCLKKPIYDRLMWTNTLFKMNRLYVMSHCKKTINSFQSAVWDPKNPGKRLDDGSYGVDNLDAFEYAFEPFVKYLRLV